MNRRVSVLNVAWGSLGLLILAGLVTRLPTAGSGVAFRPFLTPEIASEWKIVQGFTMDATHLTAVEIQPVATGAVGGRFRLRIRSVTGEGGERAQDVTAAEFVGGRTYTFNFAPFPASLGHVFHLEIVPAPDEPGHGVALRAVKGARRGEESGLFINDARRWATLVFATHTSRPAPFRALLAARGADGARRWIAVAALVGAWVTLRFVLRFVTAHHPASVPSA